MINIRVLSEETKRKRKETFRKHMYERANAEIGNRYGQFTIESINYEETEKHYNEGKSLGVFFNVVCNCGNEKVHRFNNLQTGHIKSCGCSKFNNPLVIDDLTGKTFGRLFVIGRDLKRDKIDNHNGKKGVHWLCKCSCGNEKLVSVTGYQLKSGHTQSCGCYASEKIAERNKKYSTKTNRIKENTDTIILFDDSDNECLIDKEDYNIIKNWYWRKIKKRDRLEKGYWVTNVKDDDKYNKSVLMIHQVIAEIKYGDSFDKTLIPDHLSRDTNDNRKCNIILKNNKDNCKNRGLSKANSSGKTGVSFSKVKNMWTAYITVNYKTKYLGDFNNLDDAIKARKEAEEKYGFTCDDVVASYDVQKEVI